MRRFSMGIALGLLALASTAQRASAAPVISSDSYTLSVGGTAVIFNPGSSMHIGVTVTCTDGTTTVEYGSGGSWTSLGTVSPMQTCVFEGTYSQVRLNAASGATAGTWITRGPIGTDLIGLGSVVASGSAVCVFKQAATTERRWITLHSNSGDFTLRTSSSGSDIITVAGSDDGLYYSNTAEFWVLGTGTITFEINKVGLPQQTPTTGTINSKGIGSVVTMTFDGTICQQGKVENTGTGTIKVKITYANGTTSESPDLANGESWPISCHVTEIKVTYEKAGGKAKWELSAVTDQ